MDGRRECFANRPWSKASGRIGSVDIPVTEMVPNQRLIASEYEDVEVSVITRLVTEKQVDRPSACDPPRKCPGSELGDGLIGSHRVPRPQLLSGHAAFCPAGASSAGATLANSQSAAALVGNRSTARCTVARARIAEVTKVSGDGFELRNSGLGYATSATSMLLEFGFRSVGVPAITATSDADNAASRRVLEKCGLRYVADETVDTWRGVRPRLRFQVAADDYHRTQRRLRARADGGRRRPVTRRRPVG